MNRILKIMLVIAGLAASYIIGLSLNAIAVLLVDAVYGSLYDEYIWTQYHVMGFALFYTLYIFLILVYIYRLPSLSKPSTRILGDSELPAITVVIPAYNEEKNIGRVLENVLSSNYPRDRLEVIVVDDGSSDNTGLEASKYPVRVIRHERNMGRGAAVMTGIRSASHDIVVTIDADTILEENSLRIITSYIVQHPEVGAGCGRLRPQGIGGLLGIGQKVEYILGYAYTKSLKSSIGIMLIPSGAFSFYRKSIVYDASAHETIAEDFDLGLHVIRKGYRLGYVKEAVAYTEVPSTLSSYIKQRTRWSVGGLQVMAKNRDMMFNPRYGRIGLFALPFHLVIGFAVMLMEAYGLSFLALLSITGYFAPLTLLALLSWLVFLKLITVILLLPGYMYARRILGERIGLHELLVYWTIYYYLMLYTTVRGIIVYLKHASTTW